MMDPTSRSSHFQLFPLSINFNYKTNFHFKFIFVTIPALTYVEHPFGHVETKIKIF